jgi:diguanylate cyclase (GGDEF)-like protein
MTLHVPTILLALLMSVGLFAVSLGMAGTYLREHVAIKRWAWGTWTLAGGFALLASRVVLPEAVAILLGNTTLAVSLYLLGDATHHFIRRRGAPRWQLALVGSVALCLVMALHWPLARRTTLLSVLYAAQLAPTVLLLVREGWHAERSLRTVAVTLGATTAALALRAVHATLYPGQYDFFFAATLGNGLTYLASFLFPLGAGFGFLLAHLERTAHQLQVLATIDSLTGCANRGLFDAMLRHAIERSNREGTPMSLVLMDIDHFKQLNDAHGHPAGDTMLRALGAALRLRVRASDVLARTGGEEFAVILANTDAAGSRRAAEELRRTVEALAVTSSRGEPLRVTVSIGVVTHAAGAATTPDSLYALADQLLYRAKRAGRDRWLHLDDEAPAPTPAPAPHAVTG